MSETSRGKRVLVVDDDQYLRKLFSMYLKSEGYEVLTAGNGQEAIDVIKDQDVDICVVDFMMPVMDGMRFVRWAREEWAKTFPIVVLTSIYKDGTDERLTEAGATAVLHKPLRGPEIVEKLKGILGT